MNEKEFERIFEKEWNEYIKDYLKEFKIRPLHTETDKLLSKLFFLRGISFQIKKEKKS